MSDRLRVLLVDDHDVVRAGMAAILADHVDLVGEADNVADAIELILERRPDVVVLDVRLPGGGGAAVIETVRPQARSVRFMALTVSASHEDVLQMMKAGVDGYITKSTMRTDLPELVAQTAAGSRPMSPDVAGHLLDIDEDIRADGALSRLTTRERQVVTLIARGYSYRDTARQLEISVKTLETHMSHIFEKLAVASRHELTALAYDEGYLRPD